MSQPSRLRRRPAHNNFLINQSLQDKSAVTGVKFGDGALSVRRAVSIWVPLSSDEWLRARYTAMQRQYKPGSRNRHGAGSKTDEKQFADHIMGAAAECAVAKLLGLDWTGHYDQPKSTPDIEPNFEVRWRGYSHPQYQELYVRKDDYDDRYYILTCHGRDERGFEIVGGVWGRDAKATGRWDNPGWKGWAYWVSKGLVEPIEDHFLVKYELLPPPDSMGDRSVHPGFVRYAGVHLINQGII